jgi:uncharacterized protein YhfF
MGHMPADPDLTAESPVEGTEQAQHIQAFWEAGRTRAGLARVSSFIVGAAWGVEVPPQAWAFGDTPELADELLALVLDGTKTGTSSALAGYEHEGEPVPKKGDLSILLDGAGEPRALVRTTSVDIVAFADVTEAFARTEGEDDRTLASWRDGHERYFRRTLPPLGLDFDPSMAVVCEQFEVLFTGL